MLHGNRQTGELLLGRLAKLQQKVKDLNLEFVAPDAPFLFVDGDEGLDESCHGNSDSASSLKWQRTWWHRRGNSYNGLEQSITEILELWKKNEFIGILGFSQGSRLAHLISILHTVTDGDAFKGLRGVIHVSGYNSAVPPNFRSYLQDCWSHHNKTFQFDESIQISLPSFHIMGSKDQLVTMDESEELSDLYNEPLIYIHPGGHFVPVKARDIEHYLPFLRKLQSIEEPASSKSSPPNEENAQAQIDEVFALSQIFPTFQLLSETEYIHIDPENADPDDYSEENLKYTHPICYTIEIQPEGEEIHQELWPPKVLSLHVQYPSDYPDSSPIVSFRHEMNYFEFSSSQSDLLMDRLVEIMNTEEGMPCVMSLIYAAREFFEDGGLAKGNAAYSHKEEYVVDQHIAKARSDEVQESSLTSTLAPVSETRMKECRNEGWLIACKMMEESSSRTGGKGGSWKQFTIGLVGKPSAGKSTFFNAATAFARQRGGSVIKNSCGGDNEDDILLGGAAMAPHPFTTIDPNVGFCFVPSVDGSCPEDSKNHKIQVGSCHGRANGRRLIPVLLKDVAGLVPNAYEGRGKGNKFLDDLTDADVLIHVLDASGRADAEGNKILDTINPMNDLEWIRNEIIAWVHTNIKEKWDSVVRRGRTKLLGLFSGYKQSQSFVEDIFIAVENSMKENEGRDAAFDNLESFDEGDLYRLVSAFVSARFPMGLALNKSDISSSTPFVREIEAQLPIHGCFVSQAMSADNEMKFIRHHCLKQSNSSAVDFNFEGSVWKCLQKALSLRSPLLVFPVADMQTYAPLKGFNNYATRDPSLPSNGFINCLTHTGGTAPSNWDGKREKFCNEINPALRDVLLMKPGSTVYDVFLTLKNKHVLEGEFVRAEAASNLGEKPKLTSKFDMISTKNRILMIMTTKR